MRLTGGSYDTNRAFRAGGQRRYGRRQCRLCLAICTTTPRAWDFDGHQRGNQVNLKFVHDDANGKLTFFADAQYKVEPNEDATSFGNQQTAAAANFTPYTRPFLFPNYAGRVWPISANGTPPAALGNNFSNYDSAAQRVDVLTYLKYDWRLNQDMTWSNQGYYHHNTGRGIVAGPINQAGLPGLFAAYYPSLVVGANTGSAGTLTNISNVFGGTGYEVRTTEYRINRFGEKLHLQLAAGRSRHRGRHLVGAQRFVHGAALVSVLGGQQRSVAL